MKNSINHIIEVWFSKETEKTRKYPMLYPEVWNACVNASSNFHYPSNRTRNPTRADKIAFAKEVQNLLRNELTNHQIKF